MEAKAIRDANGLNKVSQPSKALFAGDKAAYEQVFKAYRIQRRHEVLSGELFPQDPNDEQAAALQESLKTTEPAAKPPIIRRITSKAR